MKYWINRIIILLILSGVINSCSIIMTSPKQQNTNQRLTSFPDKNLPLEDDATIHWNHYLIPFIEAKNDRDCAFLIGMVHAHLRLGQMTLVLRIAQGRLSEGMGPFTVDIDHSIRIIQAGVDFDKLEQNLPQTTKKWLQDYVDGINFYQQHMKNKPIEFKYLNFESEKWTIKSILQLNRLLAVDVNWFNYFQWLKLTEKPYWNELWERFLDAGSSSIPSFTGITSIISSSVKSGSNALAIGPSLSADSSVILASDPHLGITLPNTWLIAGFKCPSYHVVGLMFPGVPMVLLGRNNAIAWGGTNMRAASSDVYELSDSLSRIVTEQTQNINVRWWFDKKVKIRSSKIGTVLSDVPLLKHNSERLFALKWVGYEITDEFTSFLKLNRATNWNEFQKAFEPYGVSGQNFLYADTAGHIGMVLAARIPKRSYNKPKTLVLSSEDSDNVWNGVIKSTELPTSYDPENGFIVSANNLPVKTDPAIGYFFSHNDRTERLSSLLMQKERIDIDYLKKLQQDVYIPSSMRLRNILIEKIDKLKTSNRFDDNLNQFINNINEWDGYYSSTSPGALAFQIFLYHFINEFYGQQYDEDVVELFLSTEHVFSYLEHDFKTGDQNLLNECLHIALKKTLKDVKKYKNWGEFHRLELGHPFQQIPLVGKRFRFDNFAAEGSYNSIMKTAHEITNKPHKTFYGANSRFIAKLNQPNENYFVLLGGQDGWVGSENFADQVRLWRQGDYIKVPFEIHEVKNEFEYHMKLNSNIKNDSTR